jgi:hypothetical protein
MTLFIILRLIYEAYFRFPHFRVMKAGMRKWINTKSGELITYQLELKTKKCSDELVFEDLWINKKKYKFQLSRKDRKIAGIFSKKEILKLNVISEIKEELSSLHSQIPEGILILGYKFKNRQKYFRVKKFNEHVEFRLVN